MGFVSPNFWPLESPAVQLQSAINRCTTAGKSQCVHGSLAITDQGQLKGFPKPPCCKRIPQPQNLTLNYAEFTYKENVLDNGESCSSRLRNSLFPAQLSFQLSCGPRVWTALTPSLNPLCTAGWKIRPFRFMLYNNSKNKPILLERTLFIIPLPKVVIHIESFGCKLYLRD